MNSVSRWLPLDVEPVPICDRWNDDCPRGMKCTFWASDGGSAWNSTYCASLSDDPAGIDEPCAVIDGAGSGLDNCEAGSMCWNVDDETGQGYCIALCVGSDSDPSCEDPCKLCTVGGGPLTVCLTKCDPLSPDCPEPEGCYPMNDTFVCMADVSGEGGQAGTACQIINSCDQGTVCVDPGLWPEGACDSQEGCCIPTCDTQAEHTCQEDRRPDR